jgi:endonuclease YncB( thermonuclease family)
MGNCFLSYNHKSIVNPERNATKTYVGYCYEVVDGDTIKVVWKPSVFSGRRKDVIRLFHIDCPEKNTVEGQSALKHTHNLCYKKYVKIIPSGKNEKYGRWLALVQVNGKDLSTLLKQANHVKHVAE